MIEYKIAGKNDIDKRYNRLWKGAGIQRLFFRILSLLIVYFIGKIDLIKVW